MPLHRCHAQGHDRARHAVPAELLDRLATRRWKARAVDPGGDFELLQQAIDEQGIKITKVLLTHGHVDHASAAGTMAEHYGVKIEGPHQDDLFLIERLPESGRKYNFPPTSRSCPTAGWRTARR
jgi:glyoxylase-like metal-dependent hydrolase (beta-lactamase superfamily II)